MAAASFLMVMWGALGPFAYGAIAVIAATATSIVGVRRAANSPESTNPTQGA